MQEFDYKKKGTILIEKRLTPRNELLPLGLLNQSYCDICVSKSLGHTYCQIEWQSEAVPLKLVILLD